MTVTKKRVALRDVAINSLLGLAGVIVALAACELFLAWDNRRPPVKLESLEIGSQEFKFLERSAALHSFHDVAAIIGDSFTVGAACGAGRNYPSYLDSLLRRHDAPYRVVNLGVAGADPFTYLSLIEALVVTRRIPSFVVVTLYSNDIELTCSACKFLDRIRNDPDFSPDEVAKLEAHCRNCTEAHNSPTAHHSLRRKVHTWLLNRLNVYNLFRDSLVGISMKLGFNIGWGRTAYTPLWQDHRSMEFKLLKFALAGMRDALGGAGVSKMMVVIYPDVENLRRDNAYVGIYQAVEADLSQELGVPVWSGYQAFLDNPDAKRNMSYSLMDHHPSCKAHEIFAEWVFGRLQEWGDLRTSVKSAP